MNTKDTSVIEIEGLGVDFARPSGRKKITAVDGLNLRVEAGEVVGFVGPNGAGKTTTIKVLMGFLEPTRGTARIFSERAGALAARRRIGYLPEVALYYPFLTARETLNLYAKLTDIPAGARNEVVTNLIARVGLSGREKERLSGYSKGMLQRIGIAQAIMGEPELLVLDEVTSGLDPVARYDVRRILMEFKAKGKTVFFSSHELSEVTMLCDRIVLLDGGTVVEESDIPSLLGSIRCVVVKAGAGELGECFPDGVVLRMVADGVKTYAAESTEAAERLKVVLQRARVEIFDVREERPSLEDYFVRKLGHRVS